MEKNLIAEKSTYRKFNIANNIAFLKICLPKICHKLE